MYYSLKWEYNLKSQGGKMVRLTGFICSVSVAVCIIAATPVTSATKAVTLTGWFSDESCAKARLAAGVVGPTNPVCAKRCIDQGKRVVFIDEKGKDVLEVREFPSAEEYLGYYIEITGTISGSSNTILVRTARKLSQIHSFCSIPKKRSNP